MKHLDAEFKRFAESPVSKALSDSMKHLDAELKRIAESPASKALSDSMKEINQTANLAGITQVSESIKRLTEIAQPTKPVQIPKLDPALWRTVERPEIRLLREVHGELEGMARLLAESARQTGDMAAVTQANLTALLTVVGELRQSRRLAAWSNGVQIALTVAILLATVVGAIAVEQEFSRQLAAFWSWVQGLRA